MIDWEAGNYNSENNTWQFIDDKFEIVVPGTIAEPNAHWLRIARETIVDMERHLAAASRHLDAFIDRSHFANDGEWEAESIEFGKTNIRFTIYYRVDGDQYGLWSVAFQPTGLPAPNDINPVYFARQQQ
jgi:hypothetical protein